MRDESLALLQKSPLRGNKTTNRVHPLAASSSSFADLYPSLSLCATDIVTDSSLRLMSANLSARAGSAARSWSVEVRRPRISDQSNALPRSRVSMACLN
jgi:hypothetical protein